MQDIVEIIFGDIDDEYDDAGEIVRKVSDDEYWVEGALRSANLVLEKAFGLAPISQVFEEQHGQSPSSAVREAYQQRATALIREYIDPGFTPGPARARSERPAGAENLAGAVTLSYFDQQ